MKVLTATVALAALVTGCASGPRYAEYRSTLAPPTEGYARVWFYRPSVLGAAVQPAIKLDDKPIGKAVPHGFFHVETPPGTHEVSATTEWKHKAQIVVSTNRETYVQLNMMMGLFVGHVIPKEVSEEEASKALLGLHLAAAVAPH